MTKLPARDYATIGTVFFFKSRAPRGGVIVPGELAPRRFSWRQVADLSCRAADGLARWGIGAGDHVAIAAGNSLEWIVADLAVHILGAVLVPLHGSLTGNQLGWQLAHSRSKLLIAGGPAEVGKMTDLPRDLRLISFTPAVDPRDGSAVELWTDLIESGSVAAGEERWQATREDVSPAALASIVYTSGTSGEPRGVMLTQQNLSMNALDTCSAFDRRDDDCRLNTLPFSHAYGRMSDLYVSIEADSWLALARSRETLVADAQQVRPTLMVVVPLLLARLRQAAVAQFGAADPAAVQKLLGGRLRGGICGGAALASDLKDWFDSQGVPVYEGYGLTEASPVISASSPRRDHPRGSVGTLLTNTEARTAGDGELLVRGPQVMAGYWRDAAATAEVLRDGWLHTGDLGTLDDNGYVYLHGRKKEFIALASGKKVWPATLEGLFAGDQLIEQLMIVGEGEAALGALVVPRDRSGEVNGAENRQRLLTYLAEKLTGRAAEEQIRRIWLLSEPWTAEREELTPKLTLRRGVILSRYADCVRQMFMSPNTPWSVNGG